MRVRLNLEQRWLLEYEHGLVGLVDEATGAAVTASLQVALCLIAVLASAAPDA